MIRWDPAKNEKLKRERGVSFEDLLMCECVGTIDHPRRTPQKILLFNLGGYIWGAPYVRNGEEMFLKTLFPSRKYTRLFKKGELL